MKIPVALLSKAEAEFTRTSAEIREIRSRTVREGVMALDGAKHVERRRAMLASVAREDLSDAFERYIDDNDLLPINYMLTGHLQARAVGRVRYYDKREGKMASATGFLVSPSLMLTNHHVFPVDDLASFLAFAEDATIEFGYEFDIEGRRVDPVVHDLDPATFLHTCESLDLALVAVRPTDRRGTRQLREQGYLVLDGRLGKAGQGDYATIIQHPDGREKQIALRNNEIISNDLPQVLIYRSDTAPGSSGAPVFNNEWQVIALHSAGVPKKNEAGEYVDKDGQVIEVVNNRVDGQRVVWVSNRGIRISAIMEHLRTAASDVALHPLVQALLSPGYADSRPFTTMPLPTVQAERSVEVPAPKAATAGPISIHITIGGDGQPEVTARAGGVAVASDGRVAEGEKKFEDEQDFADCEGFQEEFMADRIPLPVPSAGLRPLLAYRTDSPSLYILKYHHISTIHHATRRVPVVSAINVNGTCRYAALGKDTRKDSWFRDNRLDYDVQLNDEWYTKSGFDKGHLSRREDAEWGPTMAAAKRAADMTCSYANAIPQVPPLNRAIMGYHGLWGQLEGKLLEAGVENESGKSARICVFSGPLFAATDPVYKGVQVALSCFKVVVWYDGTGALRTTGFRLSQEALVGEIDFEVLRFDDVFKTYQCALTEIQEKTGLVFDQRLRDTDTWAGITAPVDEVALERLAKRED